MNKIKEPKCLKPANKKAGLMTLKIGFFIAISIGSLELGSYIWLGTVYKDTRRIDINNSLYVPAPYTGYQLRPNFKNPSYQDGHLSINSNGFRGDDLMERENVALRIACLGGSTTFSIKVGNDTTYPKLLESKLRNNLGRDDIEVINCGVGAYTTAESLATLNHRVLPLKPDIAIVYHAVNDVHPRVTGDFDPGYNHYRKALNLNLPTLYHAQSFSIFARLYSRISLSGSSSHIRHLTTHRQFEQIATDEQYQNFSQTSPNSFKNNILSIIAICQMHNIDVLLCTFTQNTDILRKDMSYLSFEAYDTGVRQHNDVLRDIAKQHKIPLADIDAKFPSNDASLFSGAVHLKSKGQGIKSNLILEELLSIPRISSLRK